MPGRSTLITSAPKSPNIIVQYGPAKARVISKIRILLRGCICLSTHFRLGCEIGSINSSFTKNNQCLGKHSGKFITKLHRGRWIRYKRYLQIGVHFYQVLILYERLGKYANTKKPSSTSRT